MRFVKYAVVVLAVVAISSTAYAMCGGCPGDTAKEAVEKTGEFVGKVVEVTVADPAKGIADGTVTVADDLGKTSKFTVKGTAKILAHTMDVLTLNQVKIGDKISVTEADGEAQTIKVVN